MKINNTAYPKIVLMLFMFLPIIFAAMLIPSHAISAERYEVDPVHSSVVFRISHLGVSFLYGRFNEPNGTITIDETNPVNDFASISVKVENIDTNNEKRDKHLKSSDFFDVEKSPEILFVTKSFKVLDENTYEVSGELTLHGVKRTIETRVVQTGKGKDPWGGKRIGFETSFSILRSDYKMDTMPDLVGDEVRLMISIEGILK